MKAIRKPIEEEIIILKPTTKSIFKVLLFLGRCEHDTLDASKLESFDNCLKDNGLKHQNNIIPFNSVIVKNDNNTITSFSIEYFKSLYNIATPDDIIKKQNRMRQLSSDIGFMGSPEYNELLEEVDNWNKQVDEFFKL